MEQILWTRDFRRGGGGCSRRGGQNIKARLRYILVMSYIDLYKPRTYARTYVHTHTRARTHTHTSIRTHIHMHIHTDTHTCTYTHS